MDPVLGWVEPLCWIVNYFAKNIKLLTKVADTISSDRELEI